MHTKSCNLNIQVNKIDKLCLFISRNTGFYKSNSLFPQIIHCLFRIRCINANMSMRSASGRIENFKPLSSEMGLWLFIILESKQGAQRLCRLQRFLTGILVDTQMNQLVAEHVVDRLYASLCHALPILVHQCICWQHKVSDCSQHIGLRKGMCADYPL